VEQAGVALPETDVSASKVIANGQLA
jgi:hypothetical protein